MSSDVSRLRQDRDRFVGFALSAAELLLEVDFALAIRYAAGSLRHVSGLDARKLIGTSLLALICEDDRPKVTTALQKIRAGGRLEPIAVRFQASEHRAMLGACHLPSGDTGYQITLGAPLEEDALPAKVVHRDPQSSAWSAQDFGAVVQDVVGLSQTSSGQEQLTLLHILGLQDLEARSDEPTVDRFMAQVGRYLRAKSFGGDAVGRIDDDKYGIIHHADVCPDTLTMAVGKLACAADPSGKGVTVEGHSIELDVETMSEADVAKVVTYAIKLYTTSPAAATSIASLSEGFHHLMSETLHRLSDLKRTVAGKTFKLVFQPIVQLSDGQVHHYEVLSRFENGKPPEEVFHFAEDIGLVEELDLAIAQNVTALLHERSGGSAPLQLAVNISGRSIGSTIFVRALEKLAGSLGKYRDNFLFEITETSEIADLERANQVLQGLRKRGHRVCIDDFGAGAASFGYLQALAVDFVKIDGAYIEAMPRGEADAAIVRSMVSLCRDLGIPVIAERVETEVQRRQLQAMDVLLGQGWLFGKPQEQVPSTCAQTKRSAAG